jgi:hypothetical protein
LNDRGNLLKSFPYLSAKHRKSSVYDTLPDILMKNLADEWLAADMIDFCELDARPFRPGDGQVPFPHVSINVFVFPPGDEVLYRGPTAFIL